MRLRGYLFMGTAVGMGLGAVNDDPRNTAIAAVICFVVGFVMVGYAAYKGIDE